MSKTTLLTRAMIAGAALAATASAAYAHHSYAMFDRTKTITISGTVLTWEMINPHSFLWVIVKPETGPQQNWGMESGGIASMQRAGVTKSAVKTGQKVEVALHPLRDGRTGGQLVSVKFEDGRVMRVGGGGEGAGGQAGARP